MARNYGDENLGNSNHDEEGEGEEALSLCDLPIDLQSKETQSRTEQGEAAKSIETEEDFNFGSWGGSVLTESEMCVADEVFFQGQILPLRLSVSSDSGLNRFRHDGRCNSRSESLDHRCCYSGSGGVSSISSRSSSCRSHISSSSTNSTSTTTTTTTTTNHNNYIIKSKVRNPFHTHPSPKPQIRVSSIRHGNAGVGGGRRQKSSIWEFLRVGLVPTPEIELQNLRLRSKNNSRSFGTRSNSTNSNNSSTSDDLKLNKQRSKKQRFFDKDGSFFSGCKCSADAIETVSSRIVIIKSKNSGSRNNESESETEVMKEKLLQIKQGKQGMSENHHHHHHHHNRTFEWLKELSIGGGGGGGLDNG